MFESGEDGGEREGGVIEVSVSHHLHQRLGMAPFVYRGAGKFGSPHLSEAEAGADWRREGGEERV